MKARVILSLSAIIAIAWGAWLIYQPLAPIVVGLWILYDLHPKE